MDYPVYQILYSGDTIMNSISLVEEPAIDENFLAFSESKSESFSISKYEQIVTGPALIPNLKILRYNKNKEPYYVYFSKETIKEIVKNYYTSDNIKFNINHSNNLLENSTIVESWFTGKNDKSQNLGYNLPEGSWMLSVYIPDETFFNDKILSGEIQGFSIEGTFEQDLDSKDKVKQLEELLKDV